MSNNTTTPILPVYDYNADMFKYWIYVGEGAILVTTNMLVMIAIAINRTLRQEKQYVLIGGMAISDAMLGIGLVIGGLGRNYLISLGVGGMLVSRMQCLVKPWNLAFFIWTDYLIHVYPLMISIDRYIAIKFPLKYYTFTTTYAIRMALAPYIFMAVNIIVAILTSLTYTYPEVAQVCYTTNAYNSTYVTYAQWMALVADILGISIYILVIFEYGRHFATVNSTKHDMHVQAQRAHEQQRKFTLTLGISCIFTFVLVFLPTLSEQVFGDSLAVFIPLYPYSFIIISSNHIFSIFIYMSRQREMRSAIVSLLHGKSIKQPMQATFVTAPHIL